MFDLDKIIREHIKSLKAYSSIRNVYDGKKEVFLDANENPFDPPIDPLFRELDSKNSWMLNRYPDPMQLDLKQKLGKIKGLPFQNIFLGNGSTEIIDILLRVFCYEEVDNVIVCPPAYEMYEAIAHINEINAIRVPLTPEEFQIDTENILKTIDEYTKIIFFCCPNSPTGNAVKWDDIKTILKGFNGIVVVDEAYIDFAGYRSLIPELMDHPNLVILQTLSKAWGLAGLRIGMAFASEQIISILNKIKTPHNINSVSQKLAIQVLDDISKINDQINVIIEEKKRLSGEIAKLPFTLKVYPSETNFILVKMKDPKTIYKHLLSKKILVCDVSTMELCEGCLRITVGTKQENELLLNILRDR